MLKMNLEENLNKILILDYGSQFTQLIARRIRELGVYSIIISHKKIKITDIISKNIDGIILSGGPLSVYQKKKVKFDKKILKSLDEVAFMFVLPIVLFYVPCSI